MGRLKQLRGPAGKRVYRRLPIKAMTVVRVEVVAELPQLYEYVERRRKELRLDVGDVAKALGMSPQVYTQLWRVQSVIREAVLLDLERVLSVDRAYWTTPPPNLGPRPKVLSPRARMRRAHSSMEKIVQELTT